VGSLARFERDAPLQTAACDALSGLVAGRDDVAAAVCAGPCARALLSALQLGCSGMPRCAHAA
jgi:hypothetical protein